jgi:hypothetical protein
MLLAALLCYTAFTALCLSMTRHYAELTSGALTPGRGRSLKLGGWLSLVLSGWAAVAADGWGFGLVQWFAALMASVLLLVFLMPFRPRWVPALALASVVLSPLAAWNQLVV